ncbi:MAG: GYD domain-containing protein [Alphaproteobacteria bacterium]|nr:GYD domain-containing protein [Alphaproteobacteria bacterium]
MARFVMLGKYTQGSMDGISASRTNEAEKVVRESGGEVIGIYALLGAYDLILLVELPDVETAMQVSLRLTRLTGVGFLTSPAVDVGRFDALASG